MSDILRLTLWSEDQIEIESCEHVPPDSVDLRSHGPFMFPLREEFQFMTSLRLSLWSA